MESGESAFGEKLFEASCKATIANQPPTSARGTVWSQGLSVKPDMGITVYVPYTDIQKIEALNFRVNIATPSETIVLLQLGQKYEEFSARLVNASGDALSKALLMNDPVVVYEAPAAYSVTLQDQQPQSGNCRARINQTSLVILPTNGFPQRIPLSSITSVNLQNYRVHVSSTRASLELFRMGKETEPFSQKLVGTQRNLEASSIETIKGMLPGVSFEELKKLSWLMLEGRAAARSEIEGFSARAWKLLEERVADSPLAETYGYLGKIGEKMHVSVGLRRTMDNVYAWFLVPMQGPCSSTLSPGRSETNARLNGDSETRTPYSRLGRVGELASDIGRTSIPSLVFKARNVNWTGRKENPAGFFTTTS